MAIYDCSQPLETGLPVYPGGDPARVEQRSTIDDGARVTDLDIGTHDGTHLDAPSHMLRDGDTLDTFDLETFAFQTRRVDCTAKGPRDPITVADLPAPGDVDLLALHTGWDDHWGTDDYRDHPYLDGEAAAWCADRGLAVGIDAFSPDPTPSATGAERAAEPDGYPAHDALLGANCPIVENLAGLGDPPETFTLYAFPLSLPGADGSPVRAVAATGPHAGAGPAPDA